MIQWAVVGIYVLAMFIYAAQEASSAGFTNSLLAKWLPHLNHGEIKRLVVITRKIGHVAAYGLLTFIVYLAASKTKKLRRGALPFAMAFAFLVAGADETYQSRLVYRTGSWSDVLIDGIGIVLVALVLWISGRREEKHKETPAEN